MAELQQDGTLAQLAVNLKEQNAAQIAQSANAAHEAQGITPYAVGLALLRVKGDKHVNKLLDGGFEGLLPRGQWLAWCAENLSFSDRQAQYYMREARWLVGNANPGSDLALPLKTLRRMRQEQEKEQEVQAEREKADDLDAIDKEPSGDPPNFSEIDRGETPPTVEPDAQASLKPLIRDLRDCILAKSKALRSKANKVQETAEGSEDAYICRILDALEPIDELAEAVWQCA